MSDEREVIHIAGLQIEVGTRLRQRCGWCGAVLIDQDLARVMVEIKPDDTERAPAYPVWEVGSLVGVIGNRDSFRYMRTVEHKDGDRLPPECCAQLDDDVTGA